jgi:hypothetical protein
MAIDTKKWFRVMPRFRVIAVETWDSHLRKYTLSKYWVQRSFFPYLKWKDTDWFFSLEGALKRRDLLIELYKKPPRTKVIKKEEEVLLLVKENS